MQGELYICGTPIGNIKDITIRCLETLKYVDIILAEDTRCTLKLLNYYNIKKPLESYNQHNHNKKAKKIINIIKEGKNLALVSDAGMPGISDPGEDLIKLCYDEGIKINVVPGATAVISALVISGFKTRSYCFEGFLPNNKKARKSIFQRLKEEARTIVLYESPHDLKNTLKDILEELGDREVAVVRELTKKYETIHKDKLESIIKYFETNEPKGEIVIVINAVNIEENINNFLDLNNIECIENLFKKYINEGREEKEAIKLIAKETGVSKREIYKKIKVK